MIQIPVSQLGHVNLDHQWKNMLSKEEKQQTVKTNTAPTPMISTLFLWGDFALPSPWKKFPTSHHISKCSRSQFRIYTYWMWSLGHASWLWWVWWILYLIISDTEQPSSTPFLILSEVIIVPWWEGGSEEKEQRKSHVGLVDLAPWFRCQKSRSQQSKKECRPTRALFLGIKTPLCGQLYIDRSTLKG